MFPQKLKDLLEGVGYKCLQGDDQVLVNDVVYDSRRVRPGCVFVCLIGSAVDSHQYAAQAVEAGAAAVVASRRLELAKGTLVLVEDTRKAMAYMSAALFGHPAAKLKTVGITGTKGKTTTACMIKTILEKGGIKTGVIGTLGVIIGDTTYPTNNTTPESYDVQKYLNQMVEEGCQCAVMEASSLGLKWHRTDGLVFDYEVFTNFSPDHIGENEHSCLEEYAACKGLLFQSCKCRLKCSLIQRISQFPYSCLIYLTAILPENNLFILKCFPDGLSGLLHILTGYIQTIYGNFSPQCVRIHFMYISQQSSSQK